MGQFFCRMTLHLGLSHASSRLDLVMYFWQEYYPVVYWNQLVPAVRADSHITSQQCVL